MNEEKQLCETYTKGKVYNKDYKGMWRIKNKPTDDKLEKPEKIDKFLEEEMKNVEKI